MLVTVRSQRDPQTYAIIGAAMEVHRQLGCGFTEAVYHDALEDEFSARAIPFRSEVFLPVSFKGRKLGTSFRADLICYGEVLVELKALRQTAGIEAAQVINYLRASSLPRGLLLNFGTPRLEYRRFIRTPRKRPDGS